MSTPEETAAYAAGPPAQRAGLDRTREFDLAVAPHASGARAILCAVVSARREPGLPVRISAPAHVVLEGWRDIAATAATAVWVRGNRLLALFQDAEPAMRMARELLANPMFSAELSGRFGLHFGDVATCAGAYDGDGIAVAEVIARKALPGWIVATRDVYDRLSFEDQLRLYSLDYVAFGARQKPRELLKVSEETDYMRSAPEHQAWGPYVRMIATWDDASFVVDNDTQPCAIGRGRANRVRFDDPYVSVEHARIVYRDREFFLIDSSTNGTFVAAHGEPHFKAPRTLKLRKPGTLWFGRPPHDAHSRALQFHFE